MEFSQKRLEKLQGQWESMLAKDDNDEEEDKKNEKKIKGIVDCEEVRKTCVLSNPHSMPVKMKVVKKDKEEKELEVEESDAEK